MKEKNKAPDHEIIEAVLKPDTKVILKGFREFGYQDGVYIAGEIIKNVFGKNRI